MQNMAFSVSSDDKRDCTKILISKVLVDFQAHHWKPNIELAAPVSACSNGRFTGFPDALSTAAEAGTRHSLSVSLTLPLQTDTYRLEGMLESRLFDEGFQQSTAKFEQPREISLIQALLGLGRSDRPCAAPGMQISLVQMKRKVEHRHSLQTQSLLPMAAKTRGDWGCSKMLI